jgi:hypothetical protein
MAHKRHFYFATKGNAMEESASGESNSRSAVNKFSAFDGKQRIISCL